MADIDYRVKIAKAIHFWHIGDSEDWDRPESWHGPSIENYYEGADQILSTVIAKGKVCDECEGWEGWVKYNCHKCHGTGKLDITIDDLIKKCQEG